MQGVFGRVVIALFLVLSGFVGPLNVFAQSDGTTVNVELILDSSGSMAERLESGETRIEAAKSVLTEVIDQLPIKEGVNVGFRVYGHKGTNTEAGKAESCQSSELKVPVDGVDKEALQAEVNAYEPVGWTPLALSLTQSAQDFPTANTSTTNAVVLVTDGLETCGGDPCAASRQIKNGAQAITTHVIGFALEETEQANLQCIVDASGGLLLGAGDASALSDALFQILDELEVIVANGWIEIESIGGVYPLATIEQQAAEATDSDPAADEDPFKTKLTTTNKVEVPVGTYLVSWPNPAGTTSSITVEVEGNQTSYIRGSIFRFPHSGAEVYRFTDLAGKVIWEDQVQFGDAVWVLPDTYRLQIVQLTGTTVLLSMDVQTLPGKITEVTVLTAP